MYPAIARSPSSAITSVDVARRAGVSQSTVSLVLSGKAAGRVASATEAKVLRAVQELGYRPNLAARALRSGAAGAVGLIVPDVTHPFFGGVLRGAQRAAWEAGYAVVMVDIANDERWEMASFEALRAGPLDGFLLFATDPPPRVRGERAEPMVLIDSDARGLPTVSHDSAGGTEAAMAHLLALGHRRFGHLASAIERYAFLERRDAITRSVEAAGIDPLDVWRVTTFLSPDEAFRASLELLGRAPRPTAVFADDDVLATGVYRAARELGLRIPDDLSLVGFDDLAFTEALSPPLTTVRIDGPQLGATAFASLAARMAGRRTPRRRILPVELVVRGSTAPPPAGA